MNAVHQMLEHMSRQMDTLRQILRVQEDKMSKAGHPGRIPRRHFGSHVLGGSAGGGQKKCSACRMKLPCVPPRNIRQFVEVLLERGRQRQRADHSAELLDLPYR